MKVDSKGRVVLPKKVRERFGLEPGTEVSVQEEDGKIVVEPEEDPSEIIADLEELIEDATEQRDQASYEELDPITRDHVDSIRRQAGEGVVESDE